MFKGLPYYIVTHFCMHGLNFTETEEAIFMKANIFQFENESLEKNPFVKNFENLSLLSSDLKL